MNTYNNLKHTGWNRVFMNEVPIKDDYNGNSMDSKELKACPHRFQILNQYKYSCYFDSKLRLDIDKIKTHLTNLHLCAYKMRMVTVAFALVNRPRMGDLIVQRCNKLG